MPRKFTENTLVIATHNPGKVLEIAALLEPFNIIVKNGGQFKLPEPLENGSTFDANARIKSEYFASHTKLPSLSDDSGIVVPALNGAPGIYSARWAGAKKDFSHAMNRIKEELKAKGKNPEGQQALFVSVLSLTWPDGHTESFEGRINGKLTFPPRGEHGFGYDPIFIPDGYTQTFGEIDPATKNAMSHRANAFKALLKGCFE